MTIVCAVMMTACSYSEKATLMCGETEIIEKFNKEVTLPEVSPCATDFEGVVSICGIDSLFLGINMGKGHHMSLYSLKDGEKIMDLFKIGNGPGEYPESPYEQRLYVENDSLFADILYNPGNELFTLDITSTIAEGTEVIRNRHSGKFRDVRYIIPTGRKDTLLVNYDFANGGFIREVRRDGKKPEILTTEHTEADLKGLDMNMVSFIPCVFDNGRKVAEAKIMLNQISVYSLEDDSYRKTICVGDAVDNLERIDRQMRRNQKRTYGGVQEAGDNLIFLYHGISEADYQSNNGHSELQIFDREFNPLVRIKIPLIAAAFYVDKKGQLYVFNPMGETEAIYRYDISPYL